MDFITLFQHMDWMQVLYLTWQHIYLVALAVGLAIIVGVPLGILMMRLPWLAAPFLSVATVLITLPSIALFGIMMPIYSMVGLGLGPAPAITAVFLYSLLPIMRNTYVALSNVDPGIREAGRGLGMTFWQRLHMVDIPLAVPLILSGIRTAVVMNIGVMTIAAVIGAGGLGLLILNGIGQSSIPLIVVGAVIVSLLAVVADLFLNVLQRMLTSKGIADD